MDRASQVDSVCAKPALLYLKGILERSIIVEPAGVNKIVECVESYWGCMKKRNGRNCPGYLPHIATPPYMRAESCKKRHSLA